MSGVVWWMNQLRPGLGLTETLRWSEVWSLLVLVDCHEQPACWASASGCKYTQWEQVKWEKYANTKKIIFEETFLIQWWWIKNQWLVRNIKKKSNWIFKGMKYPKSSQYGTYFFWSTEVTLRTYKTVELRSSIPGNLLLFSWSSKTQYFTQFPYSTGMNLFLYNRNVSISYLLFRIYLEKFLRENKAFSLSK